MEGIHLSTPAGHERRERQALMTQQSKPKKHPQTNGVEEKQASNGRAVGPTLNRRD